MTQIDLAAFHREWARLESWLAAHAPADRAALAAPAEDERVAELEERLGFALHPELKALLTLHDGADVPVIVPGSGAVLRAGAFLPLAHRLSGVDDIVAEYDVLVDVCQANAEMELWGEEELAVNLHRCVPFALPGDGGVAFVDHRPGPTYGNVYEMGIGSGDLDGQLWATSLTELFRALSDALEDSSPFLYFRPTTVKAGPDHHCVDWEVQS